MCVRASVYVCIYLWLCVCVCVCVVCNKITHIDGHSKSRVDARAVNDLTGRDVSLFRGELEDLLRKVKLRPVYCNDECKENFHLS